jgi:hypothetical protein
MTTRWAGHDWVRALAPALPTLAAGAAVVALVAQSGGYFVTTWYPAALVVLGLGGVVVASGPRGWRPPRAVLAATALLAAYAGWAFLSISWSGQAGDAWDGANRALLYALVFGVFAWRPLPAGAATAIVGLLALAIVVIGAVEVVRLLTVADPRPSFIAGRLSDPVGYPNGDAVLWTMGAFLCAGMCCIRSLPSPARGALLAGAVLLGGLALMAQSRGWLFGLPLGVLLFVALAPDPRRALLAIGAVAVGVLAVRAPVLHIHESLATGEDFRAAVRAGARAILVAAAVAGVLGAAAAQIDRRLELPWRGFARSARNILAAGLAVALLAGAGVAIASGDAGGRIERAWNDFKSGQKKETAQSRFGSGLGSNRYDFWRVGVDAFGAHPIGGLGADTFQEYYLRRRGSSEQPKYPHSLAVMALAETGLVGALLLVGALAAAFVAAIGGGMRWRTRQSATIAAAAVAAAAWWVLQGLVDWFWEFAGLGAMAFALLGLAAAVRPPHRDAPPEATGAEPSANAAPLASRRMSRRLTMGAGSIAFVAAALSFTLPWLAEREVRDAGRIWRAEPAAAYDGLRRAADLNPLSSRPYLVAGAIAFRRGDVPRARRELSEAIARDPGNGYARLQLGLAEALQGERAVALRDLRLAVEADPRDDIARSAIGVVARGGRPDVAAINALIQGRAVARLR